MTERILGVFPLTKWDVRRMDPGVTDEQFYWNTLPQILKASEEVGELAKEAINDFDPERIVSEALDAASVLLGMATCVATRHGLSLDAEVEKMITKNRVRGYYPEEQTA